jgi:hypothetical protein
VHGEGEALVGLGGKAALQGLDGPVEQGGHGTGGEDLAAPARAQIIDQMEGTAAGVQSGGEATAVSEPTEGVHQGQQGADDEVAEHHVEQQLPVRPASAVGAAPQVVNRGPADQLLKLGVSSTHLVADLDRVHGRLLV